MAFFGLNYFFYKNDYNFKQISKYYYLALGLIFFFSMILINLYDQNLGYSTYVYKGFAFVLGRTLSAFLAFFVIVLSVVFLAKDFLKELFDISFVKKDFIQNDITLLKEKEENKEPIEIQTEQIQDKDEKYIKEEAQEIKMQENDSEEPKSIVEQIKNTSQQIQDGFADFVNKASKNKIYYENITEEEEEAVIPEKFLKHRSIEDIKKRLNETDISNLDEPSYKRKNILLNPLQDNKPRFFKKQLENQNLNANSQPSVRILASNYMVQNLNTPNLNTITQKDNQEKQEIKNKEIDIEFYKPKQNLPIVEELLEEKIQEDKEEQNLNQTQMQELILNENEQEILEQEIISNENSTQVAPIAPKFKSVILKELSGNKALLNELEQGQMQKPKDFELPSLDFLASPLQNTTEINEEEIDKKIYDLLEKLRRFKIGGDVISTYAGPVVTTFEFRPAADVKVSRILNLQDDLAMALKAESIRIQAPIPGKDVVGIEVPNAKIETIYLREILESEVFKNAKSPLTIALGKDIVGNAFVTDLKKLPHLLIAGTTGSGKSVGINSMLLSLLYRNSPKTLRLMMIDPKMLEFSIYNEIPHLLIPVITDPKKAVNALSNMVAEMERRYRLMAEAKTKNIENYNEKIRELGGEELPFIVVIIDELADLMMTAGKDVEFYIGRLAQMARASGIHLIVATQRPSVDVVTGLIKANLPSRISYKVGQKIDSKVILDAMGAESLLGRGDCLFTPPGTSNIVRLHAPFASENEIEKIVEFLKSQQTVQYDESFLKDEQSSGIGADLSALNSDEIDELYEDAKRVILEDGKTSISYLQRRLKIGYNRAANIIEQLTQGGILSEPDAKGQREILI
ncbi:DNA translocase FtsK [Campylobacter sp. CCS1377]|uniref:DNA translocase FtsK n=1 Tax=Campylobacter sp. CCS1377 TaxID=3158229 RepID=A0AAU7E925_9BACT